MKTTLHITGVQDFNLKCITSALYDKLIEIIDDTYIIYDKEFNSIDIIHDIKNIDSQDICMYYEICDTRAIHSIESIIMNIIIDLNNKKILTGFGK